jgi:hypothetical protein
MDIQPKKTLADNIAQLNTVLSQLPSTAGFQKNFKAKLKFLQLKRTAKHWIDAVTGAHHSKHKADQQPH